MLHLFRKGEILPEGRTTEEEATLIEKEKVRAGGSATGLMATNEPPSPQSSPLGEGAVSGRVKT
jgi:hypothetical protein